MGGNLELRLLRCFLTGVSQVGEEEANEDTTREGWVEDTSRVVEMIEMGAYADAFSSESASMLVGEIYPLSPLCEKKSDAAEQCYERLNDRVSEFLSGKGSRTSSCTSETSGRSLDEELYQRAVMVMAVGIAALGAFVQVNVTGPWTKYPACPMQMAWKGRVHEGFDEDDWDAWAYLKLMADGSDLVGKISLPQYLIFAKLLLVNPAEMVKADEHQWTTPVTRTWWACRTLLIQQLILAERSPSLRSSLVSYSIATVKLFGTLEVQELNLGWNIPAKEARAIAAAVHLEAGLMEHAYGHDDAARQYFDLAAQACLLKASLTGVLGFRTIHQVDPKAQLVLVANSHSTGLSSEEWTDNLNSTPNAENQSNFRGESDDSDILLAPRLVETSKETNISGRPVVNGMDWNLSSLQQAVILAWCIDVKKRNPDDELRSWQMAPFIEAVDAQQQAHPSVKAWCQLLRVGWEKARTHTRERAFCMMERLVEQIKDGEAKVSERMCYVFCVPFPILPTLLKDYAEMMVSCGLVGEALKVFEELELWNNLIDCYCFLGKKAAATDLIRYRLQHQPEDPRLWCSLGDVTLDDECYHKAWVYSNHHFARAQRSLARTAYNRGEYCKSMQHWDLALALNPLHPDGWFALGSAALKEEEFDKALYALTRSVQLDPENGESWNNIAALNMRRNRSKEAFVAFREALKLKRNNWQIWENFAQVALDIANFGQAILALDKVLDLSQDKRVDLVSLTRLVEEIERDQNLTIQTRPVPALNKSDYRKLDALSIAEDEIDFPLQDNYGQRRGHLDEFGKLLTRDSAEDESDFPLQDNYGQHGSHLDNKAVLVEKVGKLLTRVVTKGEARGEIWGLKARWHRVTGDLLLCRDASLKQVRAYQGSKWQNNKDEFKRFTLACLQLCTVYSDIARSGGGNRELTAAQMLLRNTTKQADAFSTTKEYQELKSCLEKIEDLLKAQQKG